MFSVFRVSPVSDLFFEGEYKGMSEILTAEQVAETLDCCGSVINLKASHETIRAEQGRNLRNAVAFRVDRDHWKGLYDALLQGATAQRVATLMDEADRTKEAFPADSVWDQHAVQCGNCEVWLIAKNSPLKANGFPSNGLSDTGQSEDEALCGMCAGVEMYRLMDEADVARVEVERLKEDNWRLEKERNIAQVLRNDTWVELAALRARIAELEKDLAQTTAGRNGEKLGRMILAGALEQSTQNEKRAIERIAELEKERDAVIAQRDTALTRIGLVLFGLSFEKTVDELVAGIKLLGDQRDGLRRAIEAASVSTDMSHSRSCPALIPLSDNDCTCGLTYRIALRTEQTMHAAWRKRAEEAEVLISEVAAASSEWRKKDSSKSDLLRVIGGLANICAALDRIESRALAAVPAPAPPESPLISTLRYLIALDLPNAELLDRLVQAVRDANTTVDGRALTAAEMRHEGEL